MAWITTLSYDKNGDMTSNGTSNYTRNQLTGITGGTTASFLYDTLGRRESKTISSTSTNFLYDGPNLEQELNGTTPTVNYLTGAGIDETMSRTDSSGTESYLTDNLGSTLALTNSAGAIGTSYSYEPYGNTTASGTSSTNALQYTGRENDGDGLYYNRARYYSPVYGRFSSEDPAEFAGGLNLYSYAEQNPISRNDPSGLWSVTIEGYTGVGGAIIFGQDPTTGQWFYGGRLGLGGGGGFSFDLAGRRPGANLDPCGGHGTTVGTFISVGAGLGPYQWNLFQAAAGYDFGTGKTYSGPPQTGGLSFGPAGELEIGGSFGIEIIGR